PDVLHGGEGADVGAAPAVEAGHGDADGVVGPEHLAGRLGPGDGHGGGGEGALHELAAGQGGGPGALLSWGGSGTGRPLPLYALLAHREVRFGPPRRWRGRPAAATAGRPNR